MSERFLMAPVGSWPFLSRFAIGRVLVDIGKVGRTLRGCRHRLSRLDRASASCSSSFFIDSLECLGAGCCDLRQQCDGMGWFWGVLPDQF